MRLTMTLASLLALSGCGHGWADVKPGDAALGQPTARYAGDPRATGLAPWRWPRCVVLENRGPTAPIAFTPDSGVSQYHPGNPIATGERVIMYVGPGGVRFRFYGNADYPAPAEIEVMEDCDPRNYPGASTP